jgi:hypothetical protein
MLSGIASLCGVGIAFIALKNWNKQIRLQDRYNKADALLDYFRRLVRTYANWHLDCGAGEQRYTLKQSDKLDKCIQEFHDYSDSRAGSRALFDGVNDVLFSPDRLQGELPGAGNLLLNDDLGYLIDVTHPIRR